MWKWVTAQLLTKVRRTAAMGKVICWGHVKGLRPTRFKPSFQGLKYISIKHLGVALGYDMMPLWGG